MSRSHVGFCFAGTLVVTVLRQIIPSLNFMRQVHILDLTLSCSVRQQIDEFCCTLGKQVRFRVNWLDVKKPLNQCD